MQKISINYWRWENATCFYFNILRFLSQSNMSTKSSRWAFFNRYPPLLWNIVPTERAMVIILILVVLRVSWISAAEVIFSLWDFIRVRLLNTAITLRIRFSDFIYGAYFLLKCRYNIVCPKIANASSTHCSSKFENLRCWLFECWGFSLKTTHCITKEGAVILF